MKSVLVIGMGKFGRHFARKMIDLGNEVMIVDKNETIVERYSATFSDAQIADCMNKDVLLTLGIQICKTNHCNFERFFLKLMIPSIHSFVLQITNI